MYFVLQNNFLAYWSSALFIPKSSFSAFILSKSQLLCPLMWLLWYWYSPKLNILNNVSHFLSELHFQKGVVPLQRAQFWSTNKQFDNTTFKKFVEEKYNNWEIVHRYILFKVWMHPLIFEENKVDVEDQMKKSLAPVSRGCYIKWSVDLSFDNEHDACQTESYEIESTNKPAQLLYCS